LFRKLLKKTADPFQFQASPVEEWKNFFLCIFGFLWSSQIRKKSEVAVELHNSVEKKGVSS